MPGIRTEQVDLDNFAKIFLLKKDIGLYINPEMVVDVISSLTEEQKEELGLASTPDSRKRLKQLIDRCLAFLAISVTGTDPGEYPQAAVTKFTADIEEAKKHIYGTAEQNDAAYDALWQDFLDFLRSVHMEEGVKIGDKWYGYTPSAEDAVEWVPVKLLRGKYYISLEPIPADFPNASSYTWLYGVYFGGQIYSRVDRPSDLVLYPWIDGSIYSLTWFGGDKTNSQELTAYLKKELGYVRSRFPYMAANPPFIPEDGYVWVGREENLPKLPPTVSDLKFYLNCVAGMGKE